MQRIYILEDDEDIRKLVVYALQSQFVTSEFSQPSEFWKAVDKTLPDLAILDIMLPGEDGLSILRRLKSSGRSRSLPVIMLTAKSSEYDRVSGLDMGADDYISKPFSVLELVSRVKARLRQCTSMPGLSPKLAIGSVVLDPGRHLVTVDGETINLTFKEFELLQLLMENQGTVLSRYRIMSKVWDTDFAGESRTVDMHVKTLRQKLDSVVSGTSSIIKTVRGVGYKAGD